MFLKYFSEIKNRVILSIINWCSTFLICYKYKNIVLFLIVYYFPKNNNIYFITTDLVETFYTHLEFSSFISTQILIIFLIYQFFVFLSPGIFLFEYNKLINLLLTVLLIWLCLNLFLYNYIIPSSWKFFTNFQLMSYNNITLHFEPQLHNYFNFLLIFYKIIFINFVIFLFLLVYLNFLIKNNKNFIKKFRKLFFFFFISFATFITPPDVVSQLIIAFFSIVLFEIAVYNLYLKNSKKTLKTLLFLL